METIELTRYGKTFTFAVEYECDINFCEPWNECDGHGPVSDWTRRDKRPGELVLSKDRGSRRFYDFAEAVRIARRDGWNCEPYQDDETPGERAAKAARADYEFLRAWCNDDWQYLIVTVTLLDDEGDKTEHTETMGGVESYHDYHEEVARDMASDILYSLVNHYPQLNLEFEEA